MSMVDSSDVVLVLMCLIPFMCGMTVMLALWICCRSKEKTSLDNYDIDVYYELSDDRSKLHIDKTCSHVAKKAMHLKHRPVCEDCLKRLKKSKQR